MCFDFLCIFLSIFLSEINLPRSFVKSQLLLAGFNETCIFLTDSRELSYQIS
jgi:hypothetical protein